MSMAESPASLRSDPTETDQLSDYEKLRASKIEKHNAFLRSLGLISAQEELESNALAWNKPLPTVGKRKRQEDTAKASKVIKEPSKPSRVSLRQQGKQPDGSELPSLTAESLQDVREARVRECRQVRLDRARLYNEQVTNGNSDNKDPTTKLYDHTYYRIQSMTEKALENRVKAIERAAGKQCIVKMAIFKSCLQDVGMWDLAELASQALERLKQTRDFEEEEREEERGGEGERGGGEKATKKKQKK